MLVITIVLLLVIFVVVAFAHRSPPDPESVTETEVWQEPMVEISRCQPYLPVGTLTGDDQRVMQLLGRPSTTHRDRWHYMTLVNDEQIPIELQFNGRRCQHQSIGCEQVRTGDTMTASEFSTSAPLRVQLYGD